MSDDISLKLSKYGQLFILYTGQYRNSNLHLLQDSSDSDISDEKVQQYSAIGGFIVYETNRWFKLSAGLQSTPPHLSAITPITHAGAVYENRVFNGLGINLGYVTRMKERNATEFIDMVKGARTRVSSNGKPLIRGEFDPTNYDDSGYIGDEKEMSMIGLTYQQQNFSLEGWNYYINDFVNSLYLVGQYNIDPNQSDWHFTLAVQYTKQWDVSSHIAGNVDTWHYGLGIRGHSGGLSVFANYKRSCL